MNDTEILDSVMESLKYYAHENTPVSPQTCRLEVEWIDRQRGERRETEEPVRVAMPLDMVAAAEKAGYTVETVKEHDDWIELKVQHSHPTATSTLHPPLFPDDLQTRKDIIADLVYNEAFKDAAAKPETPFQHYWRCDHHPVALDNFFEGRPECGCTQEYKWPHQRYGYGSWRAGTPPNLENLEACSSQACWLSGSRHAHYFQNSIPMVRTY